MTQTHVSFTVPTTNTDGSPITIPLNYVVYVDTVNPPVKSYPVPPAEVASAANGVVGVTFAQLGFVPVNGTQYFASAVAADASGTSDPSGVVAFTYLVAPNPPTGFSVG